jgi:ribonuclease BN (tRNA processing enzyme)
MKFLPLGVGDAFTALHYSNCVAIESRGFWLLVDCPHPIRKMMREAKGAAIDVPDIGALCLTHLHADHSSGVEGFGYFSFFVARKKAQLVLHPDVQAKLWDSHLAAGMCQLIKTPTAKPRPMHFHDYFDVTSLDLARPVQVGPFQIECRKTLHHIPTTALRISDGDRTLGISADTAFDPTLISWLSEADLFIHETNYGVHTPYEKLAALDEVTRKKMRLIHYPDDFDLASSIIEPLEQGRLYTV